MKKLIVLVIFTVFFQTVNYSQQKNQSVENPKTPKRGNLLVINQKIPKFVVGLNHSYEAISGFSDDYGGKYYIHSFTLEPQLGYYPIKNLGFGVKFGIDYTLTDYFRKFEPSSFGCFVKYYAPVLINTRVLKTLRFYSEVSYSRTNYDSRKILEEIYTHPQTTNKLEYNMFSMYQGIEYNFWDNITLDVSFSVSTFFKDGYMINPRIGLRYHFLR